MFTLVQVFHRRLQVFKPKIMLQYADKNKEEIAKGTWLCWRSTLLLFQLSHY